MRRHKSEVKRRVTNRISHPHPHGALITHLTHSHPYPCCFQPPHLRRLISKYKDHNSSHANVSGDDVDIARVVEGSRCDGNGMAEGREVRDKVGTAEERVGDWGDLLEAEDENVGCGGVGEGGEEVDGEDGRVDGLAGTIECYNVGI